MTNYKNATYNRLSPNDIQQAYLDTCAIKAQQIILESKSISVSENDLIQESIENDWYHPGNGTKASDVGNLLESHGLEVSKYNNSSIQDIADCLSSGKQIIVGVDSGELWNPNMLEDIEDFAFGGRSCSHSRWCINKFINGRTGNIYNRSWKWRFVH